MNNIQVGDVCLIIHMDRHPTLVGRPCVVCLDDGPKNVRLRDGRLITQVGFGVEVDGWDKPLYGNVHYVCVPRAWLIKLAPGKGPDADVAAQDDAAVRGDWVGETG